MSVQNFISVDWGTSNFRIRLIELPNLKIIEEITSLKGVKTLYNEWLTTRDDREDYFLTFLQSQLLKFKNKIDPSLKIILSGMGSSSMGLRELPYTSLPFNTNGNSLLIETIKTKILLNPILLISGVKSDSDVIRGEETQIVGLISNEDLKSTTIFILPGTHSKHIISNKGTVTHFSTFMTGELFDVISKNTILSSAIKAGNLNDSELQAFEEGVLQAKNGSSILNSLFKIRTNSLFKEKNNTENFYYLSGLLIGDELKTLTAIKHDTLKLCAGGKLFDLYYKAISVLGLLSVTKIIEKETVDSSVIKGQWHIINQKNT